MRSSFLSALRAAALGTTALCAAAMFTTGSAIAADGSAHGWPTRPIRIVIPYSAGGAVDILTRVVAAGMEKELGQTIIVEPRPGGEGNIAAMAVANAAHDGYTLLSSSSVLTTAPLIYDKLPWKLSDFEPVARFATSSGFIAATAKLPVNSLKELADYGRSHPGLAAGVVIGAAHTTFTSKLLARDAGMQIVPVMYPGAAQHMADLYEGRIAFATISGNLACAALKDPKLKVLAMTGAERSPVAPDVPTTAEAGFPDVTTGGWYGLHAPAGTPSEVVDRIADALGKAIAQREVQQGLKNACVDVAYLGPEKFRQFLQRDQVLWEKVVKIEGKVPQ